MKAARRSRLIARLALIAATAASPISSTAAHATLLVNPAQPITQRVNVAIIQTADNSGANDAPLFGTPAQQSLIFGMVDTIWAQAGIDINFIDWRTETTAGGTYNNTFALTGTAGNNNPRPTGDLNTIRSNAISAGVTHTDPLALNLFAVRIVPGFSQTSDNTSNGLAFLNGNGITFWAGPNLTSFTGGQEVIASVLAHEIGHNLNLDHIVSAENLMQAGGSANPGQRLNSAQIAAALNSPFSVAVPESAHAIAAVMLLAAVSYWPLRNRRAC